MIATNVSGAFCHVSTAKKPSTTAVTAIASRTIAGLLPVSARRRQPAAPTSRKIISATALPTDAIAERSTRFATSSTRPAVIRSPACAPSARFTPKNGGKSRSCASMPVRLTDA